MDHENYDTEERDEPSSRSSSATDISNYIRDIKKIASKKECKEIIGPAQQRFRVRLWNLKKLT